MSYTNFQLLGNAVLIFKINVYYTQTVILLVNSIGAHGALGSDHFIRAADAPDWPEERSG